VKAGPMGVLQGLHGRVKTCKSSVMTGWFVIFKLAPVCTGFLPFGAHLVTTASPEFEALD
jgi:hypothetical protein